jgi:hypothetical protein
MDPHDVAEPQKDVREIVGEDLLDFARQGLAFLLIRFHMNLVGERVSARVPVVSPVGASGGKRLVGKTYAKIA